jgi:hypothetical protein
MMLATGIAIKNRIIAVVVVIDPSTKAIHSAGVLNISANPSTGHRNTSHFSFLHRHLLFVGIVSALQ